VNFYVAETPILIFLIPYFLISWQINKLTPELLKSEIYEWAFSGKYTLTELVSSKFFFNFIFEDVLRNHEIKISKDEFIRVLVRHME